MTRVHACSLGWFMQGLSAGNQLAAPQRTPSTAMVASHVPRVEEELPRAVTTAEEPTLKDNMMKAATLLLARCYIISCAYKISEYNHRHGCIN